MRNRSLQAVRDTRDPESSSRVTADRREDHDAVAAGEVDMSLKSALIDAVKHLGQGAVYAVLVTGVAYLWIFYLDSITVVSPLIALIGIFALLTVGWGVLNSLIMQILWFPVRKGWKVYLGQGVVISITLFLVHFLPLYVMITPLFSLGPAEQAAIVLLIGLLYAAADGYLSKSIGGHWKVRGVQARVLAGKNPVAAAPEIKPDNPDAVSCPTCGGTKLVVASDHSAYCIDCRKGILRDAAGRFSG